MADAANVNFCFIVAAAGDTAMGLVEARNDFNPDCFRIALHLVLLRFTDGLRICLVEDCEVGG